MNKKMIRQKTMSVGVSTLVSRLLGLFREMLMSRYLGAEADAFITAFKIPNSMRKIFAEGALSAAFIPAIVQLMKKDKQDEVNSLMTLSFIVFEGILLGLCMFIFYKSDWVIRLIVPGWYTIPFTAYTGITLIDSIGSSFVALWYNLGTPEPQAAYAVTYLRILIGFILLLSMSALLTGPLQALHNFFIPAFAPILLNVCFIAGIMICMRYNLSVEYLCLAIMIGGVAQFLLHLYAYFNLNYGFGAIDETTWKHFKSVLRKFFPVLATMSIMEINLFIDTSFGSLLPAGSISYLYYANRFMQIPLGVFSIALSTILLPHFSRIATYAPNRIGFYVYESAKAIFWITVPMSLVMAFFADKIFLTMFLSKKFTVASVHETANILIILLIGLFFFSLSKILLNVYYARHSTRVPLYITCLEVGMNFTFNYLLIAWGTYGITAATIISGIIRVALLALGLYWHFDFKLYIRQFFSFAARCCAQFAVAGILFYISYQFLLPWIASLPWHPEFFIDQMGFWIWVVPLCGLVGWFMVRSRELFGIKLYLLEQ